MRALLIEDDAGMQEFLRAKLEESLFAVDSASNGTSGLEKARKGGYDIIIADYALPGKNGFEISRELRDAGNDTPIIVTTAARGLNQKLLGFSVGADDYLTKPFYFKELLARIRAVLRRKHSSAGDGPSVLRFDTIALDPTTRHARRGSRTLSLTTAEYLLLHALLLRRDAIVTRAELLSHIWDNSYDVKANSIETHIANLRQKLCTDGQENIIHCIARRGYKLGYS